MTPELIDQLKRDEGFRPKPYRDTVNKLTIGYGRNLDDVGISTAEAEQMLFNDMQVALNGVYKFIPWATKLDDARLGVLANMAFNMGIHNVLMFRQMLEALESGDYDKAADGMANSKWYKQVGPRAERLVVQMRSGVWQ